MENLFENDKIKHIRLPDLEYIQFKRLLVYPELKHAYILKNYDRDFRMRKDLSHIEEVKKNLREASMAIGMDYERIIRPDFEHTNRVCCVEELSEEKPELRGSRFQKVDGLITNQAGMAFMATNADCNILLLYDPVKKVIANVHARLERYFS